MEQLKFYNIESELKITISGGVAFRKQGESLNEIIDRTDRALYLAKTGGRNRIILDEN